MNLHDTEWTLAGELTNRKRISDGEPAVQWIARAGERHAGLKRVAREGRVYDPRMRDGVERIEVGEREGASGALRREWCRWVYASRTFSARGPLGPWPVWNVTAWPSRSESNDWHADW